MGSCDALLAAFLVIFIRQMSATEAGDAIVGALFAALDLAFIFREDRRTLHDLMANSIVVCVGRGAANFDGRAPSN